MGFSRNILCLIFGLIPLFLLSGCGDLEPEMQDTRSVVLKMNFNQRYSSRNSQISQTEVSSYKTHLILALPAWENLNSNYRNYYSSFAQELMNPQDGRVSMEIPLNTELKIFVFLFTDDYSLHDLITGTRNVGYYGKSRSFLINNQTNDLSLGVTLQSSGSSSSSSNTASIEEVTAIGTSSYSKPNYTFASTITGTITYGGSCSSATTSAIVGNNYITFNALSNGTYSNCTIKVTDPAGNESNTLTITSFNIASVFLTIGANGIILKSSDGLSWDNITSGVGTSTVLWRTTYGKNIFLVTGSSGTILTSPDGTTWTSRISPISSYLRGIIFRDDTFVKHMLEITEFIEDLNIGSMREAIKISKIKDGVFRA